MRRIRRDLIVLAASLAVFSACAVVAADGRVGPTEKAVFNAINGLPGWLYRPMLVAQYFGVQGTPLIFAAGALLWRHWRLAAALVLVVPCKLALEWAAKVVVQRQRPGTTVPGAILRGVPHGGPSFPSGHAIIAFAIAGLLVLVLPRIWGLVAVVLAASNGLARIYLGAHNPLDVVGGAAIGLLIAAVLDMILDVARDRGRGPLWKRHPTPGRPAILRDGLCETSPRRACSHIADRSPDHARPPAVQGLLWLSREIVARVSLDHLAQPRAGG